MGQHAGQNSCRREYCDVIDVNQGSDRSTPRKEATNAGRERNIKALKAAGATQ